MGQRDVAELIDESLYLGARASLLILIARRPWAIRVGSSVSGSRKQSFVVEPAHHRHVGRVGPRRFRLAVERFHHLFDVCLALPPDLLHDLRLEFVQRRGDRRCFWSTGTHSARDRWTNAK